MKFVHIVVAAYLILAVGATQIVAPFTRFVQRAGLVIAQNVTSLSYNVTAGAQTDAYGYGPGYQLSGVTQNGYLYFGGLDYNYIDFVNYTKFKGGYFEGYTLEFQVFSPALFNVYGRFDNFSGPVNSGDKVVLNLSISGGQVVLYAKDWNTGAWDRINYTAIGAENFLGRNSYSAFPNGTLADRYNKTWFTGIYVDTRHVDPYSGPIGNAYFQPVGSGFYNGTLFIRESEVIDNRTFSLFFATKKVNASLAGPAVLSLRNTTLVYSKDGALAVESDTRAVASVILYAVAACTVISLAAWVALGKRRRRIR